MFELRGLRGNGLRARNDPEHATLGFADRQSFYDVPKFMVLRRNPSPRFEVLLSTNSSRILELHA